MCQEQVSRAGTSDYIQQMLRGANSFPCPWYLLLVQPSSNPINNTNMTTWRWREAKQSKSYSYFLDTKPRLLTKPTSHLEHGSVIISKLLDESIQLFPNFSHCKNKPRLRNWWKDIEIHPWSMKYCKSAITHRIALYLGLLTHNDYDCWYGEMFQVVWYF